MSLTIDKLKNLLPNSRNNNLKIINDKNKNSLINLIPEVGLKLILESNTGQSYNQQQNTSNASRVNNVPELNVLLMSARHLQSTFGLKSVEGYVIKVKLFPGTLRYDSTIQTSSWPKFNETFKFPLVPSTKSSMKRNKETSLSKTLPEKLFKGHFLVLTVYALLELPPGTRSSFKEKYHSIKRKGSLLLRDREAFNQLIDNNKNTNNDSNTTSHKDKDNLILLTKSESCRNIGSVTVFLDPKIFIENIKNNTYYTEEMWLPIIDLTVTPSSSTSTTSNMSVMHSAKGQLEIILQLCDTELIPKTNKSTDTDKDSSSNDDLGNISIKTKETKDNNENTKPSTSGTSTQNGNTTINVKRRFSLNDFKRKLKSVNGVGYKKDKNFKGLCLKIITSKMRCPIRVKEEFENVAVNGQIYIKTTVFEHNIPSASWRTEMFSPSLSSRWDRDKSTIEIPLPSDASLDNIAIKATVATKTKIGKKIILGTILLGPNVTEQSIKHWDNMITLRGTQIPMWYNFQ